MGFQVWITRLDTPPGTNSEVHYHAPCSICFALSRHFSPSSKRLWDLVSVFVSNISIPWVLILLAGVSPSYEFITKSIFLYIEVIFFRPPSIFAETSW